MNSQSSFSCNQMGPAFLAMNSSTLRPSINAGRGTRFCLPLMKIVINFFFRSRRARFSAVVRLRFGFAIDRFHTSQPLFVAILRRRFAHPLDDTRISVQDRVGVNKRQITTLRWSEVGHDILSIVNEKWNIQIPRSLVITQRQRQGKIEHTLPIRAQLSKSRHQRSICAGVTHAGSSTNDASMRASYQPVSQSAAASSWFFPRRLAIFCIVPTDTPNALSEGMPYRAMPSRTRFVALRFSEAITDSTSSLSEDFVPFRGGLTGVLFILGGMRVLCGRLSRTQLDIRRWP